MSSFAHRFLFVVSVAVALGTLSFNARSACAQSGNWDYVEELGGWLDWDTGLVWGEYLFDVNDTGQVTWDWANTYYVPYYRDATGISSWRLATLEEAQTASAHGVFDLLYPDAVLRGYTHGGDPYLQTWTSTKSGRWAAYVVELNSGGSELHATRGPWGGSALLGTVLVYRAFGEEPGPGKKK